MPSQQEGHFAKEILIELFASRIVKSRAVGLDGTKLERFEATIAEESALIERKVVGLTYSFTKYREKLISKGVQQYPRQISIPTVRDRLTLRSICNCLTELSPAARTPPPHTFIKNIATLIADAKEPLSFLRVDVKNFFPSLRHDLLHLSLQNVGCEPFLLDLINKAISNGTGHNSIAPQERGVPQGLSISNLLSSIYMLNFDQRQKELGNYHRYVDDILIIAPSHQITRRYTDLHVALTDIGLDPHPMNKVGKTEIRRIGEGVDYLGYHLTPNKISVRTSSYNRMFANLSKVFTLYKYKKNLKQFIFKLNIRITGCVVDGKRKGWLMFFSQMDAISQLNYLDQFVAKQFQRIGLVYKDLDVARFVKTYHEIRYHGIDSQYIPNFDHYTLEQQYQLISSLTGTSIEELNSRSREATDYEFKALVAKEVADLEQDVIDSSS